LVAPTVPSLEVQVFFRDKAALGRLCCHFKVLPHEK
jgi:hypothetical protein